MGPDDIGLLELYEPVDLGGKYVKAIRPAPADVAPWWEPSASFPVGVKCGSVSLWNIWCVMQVLIEIKDLPRTCNKGENQHIRTSC